MAAPLFPTLTARLGALLHTDERLMPRAVDAHASWNFRRPAAGSGGVLVTYDMTRLQRLTTDTRYLVTLGGEDLVDPSTVIARREYAHPLYTPRSVAAQRRLPELDSDRLAFAGAYHGWGFHEDGARSGLAAAERLGLCRALARVVLPDVRRLPGVVHGRPAQSDPAVLQIDFLDDHGDFAAGGQRLAQGCLSRNSAVR